MFQRFLVGFLLLGAAGAQAEDDDRSFRRAKVYRVTITNLTKGQVLSPPAVATHRSSIAFFESGEAAIDELAVLAETGDAGPLVGVLNGSPQVFEAVVGAGAIRPGESLTVVIRSNSFFDRISVATMLVNTNDAFAALNSGRLPRRRHQSTTTNVVAYDAGSEANNEGCAFVPGPACGGGERDTTDAEGFVHIHNGVHGVGDLEPSQYDWRNPAARIRVVRVR